MSKCASSNLLGDSSDFGSDDLDVSDQDQDKRALLEPAGAPKAKTGDAGARGPVLDVHRLRWVQGAPRARALAAPGTCLGDN